MSDNSEQTQSQTNPELAVDLVQSETNIRIGVQLVSSEGEEEIDLNQFHSEVIRFNGVRYVVVSKARDTETGEMLLVLEGDNGDRFAIQPKVLSMIQTSGEGHIHVEFVTQSEETGFPIATHISCKTCAQSVTTSELTPVVTSSSPVLPNIVANIPSETSTAPTNVVQALDTPRVTAQESNDLSVMTTTAVPKKSGDKQSDESDCGLLLNSSHNLYKDKRNHLCGFGLKSGQRINKLCDESNITNYMIKTNKTMVKTKLKDRHLYRCVWKGCDYPLNNCLIIKKHIHRQHCCPFRNQSIDSIISEKKIKQNFNEIQSIIRVKHYFERNAYKRKQFNCKKCRFNCSELRSMVDHIQDMHLFAKNQIQDNVKHIKPKNFVQNQKLESNLEKGSEDGTSESEPIWFPFKCHLNDCKHSFLTIEGIRKHFKRHNN